MTAAPVFDPLGLRVALGNLTKHGGPGPHKNGSPQSVHGGGGGGSADYPIGHVVHNPLTISTGDFRQEADPARRFTELWQRTFEGYDLVREAAQRVLDGKDPLGDPRDPDDSHSIFMLAENGTWINGDYTEADLHTDIASAGRFMADGLRNAQPRKKPLFRGTAMPMEQVHRLAGMAKSGETFHLWPSSTSPKLEIAQSYANGRLESSGMVGKINDTRVVFRFPEGTKALGLSEWSDWSDHHPEAVIAGRFRVAGVFQNSAAQRGLGIGSKEPEFYVNLEPVEQP